MHYSQEYANNFQYGNASAPTESGHAPAYYHGGELRQQRGNRPFHYVQSQSQSPRAQRMPMSINATPGYFYSGCWYNAGLQKPPVALVQQPEVQPQLQQHVPQFYMPSQQQQQLEHAAPSYPSQQQQQQHIFYPLQPQAQNLPLFYPSQQQVQVMPLTYPSQQQEQVIPSTFPSQQQQVQLMPLSYPSQQQQQQVLPQAAPSYLAQQGQIMPPSYPSQQVIPSSFPSQQQQQTYPSRPVPQYQVVPQVMPQVMPPAMPTLPVIMEETPENQESQESQVLGATEAQEPIKIPPQLVEICLGPGVQVTRSQDKLTIDIGMSNADNSVTEKQGCLKDMFCKLFRMIKRYAFSSRVARARRNRLRHLVTKKRSSKAGSSCPSQMNNDNVEKSTLMEDKDTQTFETLPSKDPKPVPIQMEVLPAQATELEEIPLPEDHIPELEVHEVALIPLPGTLISEEHSSMEPQPVSKVDLNGKQDPAAKYLPDPVQQKEIAQPMATSEATPKPLHLMEEKILQPMISSCLELIGKALIPPPPPPLPLPEVIEELKEPIVDTSYWPPLGSRPPKAKQLGTPEKPKDNSPKPQSLKSHRFTEYRFMGSSYGSSGLASRRILRKLERCENHSLSKLNEGKIEVEVAKVPAADVKPPQNSPLSPKNDKKTPKSLPDSPQKQTTKQPSVQISKRHPSEPQAVARNMFALLDQLVEEPSPEISAEAKNQKADARQEKDKREARKTKKLKRRLKKKERAQRIRLEAKEKAAKAAKEAMEEPIINVKDIPIPETASLLKPKFNLQDMIPKPQRLPTKPTIDKALKEAPVEAKPAGEGKPTAKDPQTEAKDQVLSLVASLKNPRRLHLRSPFLEAVATARKSSGETPLSRKRKLWEKRKSDD